MLLVLDTNVWLDLLVFDDPIARPLRNAELFIDQPCLEELERALGYSFRKSVLPPERRKELLSQCRSLARLIDAAEAGPLPRCKDPDDQKFLVLASAAGADVLVTKDLALLALRKKTSFRICKPDEVFDSPP